MSGVAGRLFAAAGAALVLGGCDPRLVPTTDLNQREIAALSGKYDGRGNLSRGDVSCVKVYLWSMSVAGGRVEGSVINSETPNAQPARITTFVDYDGNVVASVRTGGQTLNLNGVFLRSGFRGQTKTADDKCLHTLRLTRTDP